jgi:hypothetical protein
MTRRRKCDDGSQGGCWDPSLLLLPREGGEEGMVALCECVSGGRVGRRDGQPNKGRRWKPVPPPPPRAAAGLLGGDAGVQMRCVSCVNVAWRDI